MIGTWLSTFGRNKIICGPWPVHRKCLDSLCCGTGIMPGCIYPHSYSFLLQHSRLDSYLLSISLDMIGRVVHCQSSDNLLRVYSPFANLTKWRCICLAPKSPPSSLMIDGVCVFVVNLYQSTLCTFLLLCWVHLIVSCSSGPQLCLRLFTWCLHKRFLQSWFYVPPSPLRCGSRRVSQRYHQICSSQLYWWLCSQWVPHASISFRWRHVLQWVV